MAYILRDLIKASGYAGTAGQRFRTHVTGAASGAALSQYKCGGWSFSGEPDYPTTTYSDHASFTITVTFSEGVRAYNIRRLGTTVMSVIDWVTSFGFSIESSSYNITTSNTFSLTVQLRAPCVPGITFGGTAWFTGYTSPTWNPAAGNVLADVTFRGFVNAEAASGTEDVSFRISYAPDIGPFNPTLTQIFPIRMNRRATDTNVALYDWQWYTDSGYTSLYSTSNSFIIQTLGGDSRTYYLRARQTGTLTWNNVGAVTWVDPRPAI